MSQDFIRIKGTYAERAEQIGEHWTFHMERIQVLITVELAAGDSFSDDSYFNAKRIADATFKRLYGRYASRSDICSNPEESRRNNLPEGLDAFAVLATAEDKEESI